MSNQIPPISPDGQSVDYRPLPASQVHVANQQERAYGQSPSDVRKARDRAQYVRQQKGHSLLLHLFIIGPITLWIPAIYFSLSPNHYWHA